MKTSKFLFKILLALALLFSLLGAARAQSLVWMGSICWQNVSNYDVVRVHWQPTNNSWWDTNMTANGVTIGSVGNGSSYAGYREVPGSGISLGWYRVGCGGPFGICSAYRPSLDTNQCNPVFEDSQISPTEGYYWFEGARYASATMTLSKAANPRVLAVGASGQSYSLTIGISNGPTTQAIAVSDFLPTGVTTSGNITSNSSMSGCPGPGSSSLSGCTIAAGVSGTVVITVPVNVSAAAANHTNFNVTNAASISGGGSAACTNNSCQASTTNAVINAVDDTDSKAAGIASSTNVSPNDTYPTNSTFMATGGSCAGISPTSPASNTTGLLGYTLPTSSPSCTVNYRLCAPAPNASVCDNATLTVTSSGPSIAVKKALGGSGRVVAADQFTVQLLRNGQVVNSTANSTTAGSGSLVDAGTGTTGSFAATAGTAYAINEVGNAGTVLGRYSSSVACTLNGIAQPAFNLGGSVTPTESDVLDCTITNRPKAATLTVRQVVLGPVPPNLLPPFTQEYTGNNGWTPQTITNTRLNLAVSGATRPLAANNTATTLSTTLPGPRWFVIAFSCTDTTAAISGNPTANLVSTTNTSITIPAQYVLPGASLRCTMALGHLTP